MRPPVRATHVKEEAIPVAIMPQDVPNVHVYIVSEHIVLTT
jgi:hypothetical protein